ncbi:hypothetical protein EON73_02435 [bacterium]|nr:MAG: hypothetical protein EON73_02435 [bacterium]
MSEIIKKVWGSGPLKIGDVEIQCYILEDGTPVLNKGKMMLAIGRQWKGASRTDRPNFIGAMNLQPFIRPEMEEMLKGVDFYDGGRLISGYDARILPMVCKIYWEANRAKVLTPNQLPVAEKCEVLTHAFSMVGITALIYEQLGFEKYKHPEAFRILIESYLSEEIRKWSKEFPDELFWQLDRIYQNQRTTSRNRPMYYAKFIRKYIYEPIEHGQVLRKLDEKVPKNEKGYRPARLHSATSENIGLPALRSQIWQVIGALKVSPNKRIYETNFNRMMGNGYQTDMFE